VEQSLEYLDNQRPLFSFHTKLISTVYTHDPALDSWFQRPVTDNNCALLKEAGTTVVLFSLFCVCLHTLLLNSSPSATSEKIQFMPTIFDRLWEMMCMAPNQKTAVEALEQAALLCEAVSLAASRGARQVDGFSLFILLCPFFFFLISWLCINRPFKRRSVMTL
jgi:hypothetical protein